MTSGFATVKGVTSGDTLLLVGRAAAGPPASVSRVVPTTTLRLTPRVRSLRPCPAAVDHGVGGALGTAGRVAVAVTAKVALCCVDRLVQLPGLGACDVHGDAPSMVADERDLPVGLVRGAVDPGARLAPEAADLVRRWGAEAAAEVLVEEQAHLVALDGQRIVVLYKRVGSAAPAGPAPVSCPDGGPLCLRELPKTAHAPTNYGRDCTVPANTPRQRRSADSVNRRYWPSWPLCAVPAALGKSLQWQAH